MIVIPMAGKSSRFFNEGYTLPKYMLNLGDSSTVFEESLKSFKNYFKTDLFVFLCRSEESIIDFITIKCTKLGISNFKIIPVAFETDGQADTVNIGLKKLESHYLNENFYIYNIDSVRIDFTKPKTAFLKETDGYLEVFKGKGEHWSFIEPGIENQIVRTTEKIRISEYCSNGLYYFSSLEIYFKTFDEYRNKNLNKELYIAPMYNILINQSRSVKYLLISKEATIFLGTPVEYETNKIKFF
jgi:NDP-sugar pyrophosphorylase family protein